MRLMQEHPQEAQAYLEQSTLMQATLTNQEEEAAWDRQQKMNEQRREMDTEEQQNEQLKLVEVIAKCDGLRIEQLKDVGIPMLEHELILRRELPDNRRQYNQSTERAKEEAKEFWNEGRPDTLKELIMMPQTNEASADAGDTLRRAPYHELEEWAKITMDVAEELLYAAEDKHWQAARALICWTAAQSLETGTWIEQWIENVDRKTWIERWIHIGTQIV